MQLVAVVVSVSILASPALAGDATPAAAAGYAVFATSGNGTELVGIDPASLVDLGGTRQEVGQQYTSVAVSADGSTSVVIDGQQGALEDWITVHDGVLGAVRRTVDVTETVYNPMLSADGSRLVAQPTMTCGPSGCGAVTWHAYDTRTGKEVATIPVDLNAYLSPVMLSPDGARLYVPYYEAPPPPSYPATPTPAGISATGPWPLRIAIYDVDTGAELLRREVSGTLAGTWPIESELDAYASEVVEPAIALSPDGSTIAIVDAAMTTLTLLDARALDVVATRDIHRDAGLTRRALGWLGILPAQAEAKTISGTWRVATFSADGASLYVTGYELDSGDSAEHVTGHGDGVTRLDVATGKIEATALDGADVRQVVPSPDGATIYLVRSGTPWWEATSNATDDVLVRLDASSLEPLARRDLEGWALVFVVPGREPGG
jgi:hypothetical protein